MKTRILAAGAALAMLMAAPAFADSIDFSQFGPDGTNVADGTTGVTAGGVDFTIISPGAGFQELQEGASWAGEFAPGETILYDNGIPGLVTIDFAKAVTSIQDLEAQANLVGAYTATLTAYDGLTQVGSVSYDADNELGPEGTIPHLDIFGSAITSITIGTSNDGEGLALGGTGGTGNPPPPVSGAPEPSTWALLIAGIGGVGFAFRQAKKKHSFSFAKALSA